MVPRLYLLKLNLFPEKGQNKCASLQQNNVETKIEEKKKLTIHWRRKNPWFLKLTRTNRKIALPAELGCGCSLKQVFCLLYFSSLITVPRFQLILLIAK